GCMGTVIGDQLSDPVLPNTRLTLGGDYSSANSCIYRDGVGALDLEACDTSSYSSVNAQKMTVRSDTPGAATTHYVQLQAPNTVSSYNFVFPTTSGAAGPVLTSQSGSTQTWADVSRLVSTFGHSTGATITVPARLNVSIAYQLFDFERTGTLSGTFMDTWDT